MNKRLIPMAVAAAALSVAFAQSDPQKDFVASTQDAYFLMTPEFVCGAHVERLVWSQDGERLAVLRTYIPHEEEFALNTSGKPSASMLEDVQQQIYTWGTKTRKPTMVFALKPTQGTLADVNWVAGSSSLVVEAAMSVEGAEPTTTVFLISNSGDVKRIAALAPDEYCQLSYSPTKPVTALIVHKLPKRNAAGQYLALPPTIRFFGIEGVLSQPITAPSSNAVMFWSQAGQPYLMTTVRGKPSQAPKQSWFAVDRSSDTVHAVDEPAEFRNQAPPPPTIFVDSMTAKAAIDKVGVNAPVVILKATHPLDEAAFGVVTTDGNRGEMAPKEGAVAYVSQENAMVRRLTKVPLDAYRKARYAALRTKLLGQAKQVGLAILMSCNDNNDNFPSNKGNWQAGLTQYSKDPNLFDGFNYTFGGGNASSIESPAETILGYIDGPGGRAVVFSDGHAKWIANP
ncbi:MAG: hypothetical protein P4L46_06425 [Fimbriimonas sp.]|nr:hypothetical protein [Fimbriimonas sp.]